MNKHMFGNSFIVVFIVSITFCAWGGLLVLLGGPGPPGPPLGYGPGYTDEINVKVKFVHPHGLSTAFKWIETCPKQ